MLFKKTKILAVSCIIGCQSLFCTSATWNTTNGNWQTGENWTPNDVPFVDPDVATFPVGFGSGSTATIGDTLTTVSLGGLNVAGGGTIARNATQTLTINGPINITEAGTTTIDTVTTNLSDPAAINIATGATFNIASTTTAILTAGDITVTGPGTFVTGPTTGGATVLGTVTIAGNGVYKIDQRNDTTSAITAVVLENGSSMLLKEKFIYNISGAGEVNANHAFSQLTGTNTYSGGTNVLSDTLTGTTDSIPAAGGVAIGAGFRLTFDQDTDGTYSGIISGATGNIEKAGSGNVTLSGANTYGGGATVNAGTLTGTTDSIPSAVGVVNNDTLAFDQDSDGTYSGPITASGALIKLGTGNVTLSGANTYTGLTTVSAGTLTVPTTNIPLTNNVTIASGATLALDPAAATVTYTGNITGDGGLTKLGTGPLTLSGTNDYTGTTTISAGDLTTTVVTGSGDTSIASGSTLTLNQPVDVTYGGAITGTGGILTKTGAGYLTLSGANTYTGDTTVNEGVLRIEGTIAPQSTTTVLVDAGFGGSGNVGPVNNNGTIAGGSLLSDILTINGDYTQAGDSPTLGSLIRHDGTASQVTVTGSAILGNNGILQIEAFPGAYLEGTTFTLIDAAAITGDFDVKNLPKDRELWETSITDGVYTLTVLASHLPNLPAIESFPNNPRDVGLYFFDDGVAFESEGLRTAANATLDLPVGGPLEEALIRLSPLTQSGNINANFQNNIAMTIVLDRQFQQTAKNHSQKSNKCAQLQYAEPQSGGFVQPIALFYNQDQTTDSLATTQQIAFNASTYGVGIGYNYVLDNQYIIEGGIGYTYSNLNWKRDFGGSSWNSLYLAPFFGWFNDQAFANIMFMWAANFYDTNRKIQFPGFTQTAKSNYNSFDFLIRANGGFQSSLGDNYWIRPEATLNYLADVRESYTESGAGGISLHVKRQVSNILQPSVRVRFIKEIMTNKFCYSPNLYVGWLANIPLDNGTITARFIDAPSNLFFNVQGGNQTTNQLVLGAEFFAKRFDQFEVTSNFEADILSHFQIYTVKVKFEWMF